MRWSSSFSRRLRSSKFGSRLYTRYMRVTYSSRAVGLWPALSTRGTLDAQAAAPSSSSRSSQTAPRRRARVTGLASSYERRLQHDTPIDHARRPAEHGAELFRHLRRLRQLPEHVEQPAPAAAQIAL